MLKEERASGKTWPWNQTLEQQIRLMREELPGPHRWFREGGDGRHSEAMKERAAGVGLEKRDVGSSQELGDLEDG